MKKLTLALRIALFVVLGSGWVLWIHDKWEQPSASVAGSAPSRTASFDGSASAGRPYPASSASSMNQNPGASPMGQAAMQQRYPDYLQAQQKAMRDNPALIAEEREIIAELDAQREKLDAAMIKADPKVAPIVAKLEAMHQRALAMAANANRVNGASPLPPTLSK